VRTTKSPGSREPALAAGLLHKPAPRNVMPAWARFAVTVAAGWFSDDRIRAEQLEDGLDARLVRHSRPWYRVLSAGDLECDGKVLRGEL